MFLILLLDTKLCGLSLKGGYVMKLDTVMLLPISRKMFEVMFEVKSCDLKSVLDEYDVCKKELHDALWEEFDIPGMENRIANTAFDFLIDCCRDKRDLCKTLKGEIKKDILMSAIFYTIVMPSATSTANL